MVDRPYQAKDDRADSADRPARAKYEVCDHVVVSRPAFNGDAHIYDRPEKPEDCDAKRDDEVGMHVEGLSGRLRDQVQMSCPTFAG